MTGSHTGSAGERLYRRKWEAFLERRVERWSAFYLERVSRTRTHTRKKEKKNLLSSRAKSGPRLNDAKPP